MGGSKRWTTIHKVEAFVAVADTLSYKAATRVLRNAGATLKSDGRSTWQLIEQFRVDIFGPDPPALFERVPLAEQGAQDASLRLTRNGEHLLDRARDLLAAATSLHDAPNGADGPLRLACYPAHIRRFVARLMATTGLDLDVSESDDVLRAEGGSGMFNQLARRATDVVVAPRARDRAGIESVDVYSWRLVAVFYGREFESREGQLDLAELEGRPLLLSPRGHSSRMLLDGAMTRAQVEMTVAFESSISEALLSLAEAGVGVAILPSDSVWKARGRYWRGLAGEDLRGWHALHWRKGEDATDERVGALLSAVRKIAEDEAYRGE